MGDGLVLEQGTHDELLSDENGAYFRLVAAQKLREAEDAKDSDSGTAASHEDKENTENVVDMEKAAREEIPLGRKNTGHSLASEIIEQRQKQGGDVEKGYHDYGLPYLFKRMGILNREGWVKYVLGSIFACSTYSPCFATLTSLIVPDSVGHGLSCIRNRLRLVTCSFTWPRRSD